MNRGNYVNKMKCFSKLLSQSKCISNILQHWTKRFESNAISEAECSAEYIIAHVLGYNTLYDVDQEQPLNNQQSDSIDRLCQKRLGRMPVQYVIGEWSFLDLTLKMRQPVLIPRPETEELALHCMKSLKEVVQFHAKPFQFLEVGCGTGAISLSLLSRVEQMSAVCLDVSPEACQLTRENAASLKLDRRVTVIEGDFFCEKVQRNLRDLGPFSMLVSNPPYITSQEMKTLQPEITQYEDPTALDGGLDGLDIVREILLKAPDMLVPQSSIWLEVGPQHPPLVKSLVQNGLLPKLDYIKTESDLFGKERFCCLQVAEVSHAHRKADSS